VKTLVVFDFDDTLFHSGARILVRKPSGDEWLSTHEYAIYEPGDDDEFDFSEFAAYPPRPEPIVRVTRALQSAVLRWGIENVIILTARGYPTPVEEVLENFQMPPIEVVAIASSNPEDKATMLENLVTEVGYTRLVLYEDSKPNIAAIRKRLAPILGDMFFAYRVIPRGDDVRVKKETR